ncbi:ABC transporter ATP-binding protein [Clostridiaceae bacterium HSG29]|nr:ABC transporter ATP-binding protein [Clostridiaceae bacterium HSG29]
MKKLVNDKFISISNLIFSYKKNNLFNNFNLSLDNNMFTSIIGENGSGKTTLTKLICGMITPNFGNVFIENRDVSKMNLSEVGNIIGYLFQNPEKQIFGESVIDELSFAMKFNGISIDIINGKVEHILEKFDLEEIKDQKCHLLSHGEKQRVALSTIFLKNPKYLILDEPTTGLDVLRKEMLYKLLNNIKNDGVGILMISHDLEFVDKLSDRIIMLENGRVIKDEYCS